jgi:hypothetical protein
VFPSVRFIPVVFIHLGLFMLSATPMQAATGLSPAQTVWNENVRGTLRGFRRGAEATTIRPQQMNAINAESMRRISTPAASPVSAIANPIFSIPPAYGSGGAGARSVLPEDFNGEPSGLSWSTHPEDSKRHQSPWPT